MASRTAVRSSPGFFAAGLAVLIGVYQRRLSPYKGFCCAHRVAHGGLSCSAYAKHLLLRRGVMVAVQGMRPRFAACAAAAVLLHATASGFDDDRRRTRAGHASDAAECCMYAPDPSTLALAGNACDAASCIHGSGCIDAGSCLLF